MPKEKGDRGRMEGDWGRKSGDGEWMGVGWNWKTGMISDYDELQKNQTQNGPLTVKTPPLPALVPLLPGGCRAAGGGRTVSG